MRNTLNSASPLALVVLALATAAALGCASGGADQRVTAATPAPAALSEQELAERWGIEIVAMRLSAAGYMLDFRYKVTDAGRAAPLFERRLTPLLIDEASGARMGVPAPAKVGPLRNSNPPIEGRTYFMFFANPGRYIKPGNKVTVMIGEFRAPGLVVE